MITAVPQTPVPAPADPGRVLYPALVGVFPVLGVVLALAGMQLGDIVELLATCAGLGLATVAVFHGGKRLAAVLSSALRDQEQ
ncbi:hypothetical protein [Streptomyces sp. NPDC096030]|uniref:hypothetical protein n=1 Tax=Streptomyces sp. NPDC096030 TaxID=3155423 RepID=UPI0033308FB6